MAAIALNNSATQSTSVNCDPQLSDLSLNSSNVSANDTIEAEFSISGPISNATFTLINPNGSKQIIDSQFTYPKYIVIITNTSIPGAYTINATVISTYGQVFSENLSFQVVQSLKQNGQACLNSTECSSLICLHEVCRHSNPFCSDSVCEGNETCLTCSSDCGVCPSSPPPSSGGGSGGGSSETYYSLPATNLSNSTNTTKVAEQVALNKTEEINKTEPIVIIPINQTNEQPLLVENTTAPPITGFAAAQTGLKANGLLIGIVALLGIIGFALYTQRNKTHSGFRRY